MADSHDQSVMGARVCWNCKGLSVGTKLTLSQMNDHMGQCPKQSTATIETSVFDYYICDKADFFALSEIKQSLSKDVCQCLKNRKANSWMDVSNRLVESLLKLSFSKTVETARNTSSSKSAANNSFRRSSHGKGNYTADQSVQSRHSSSDCDVSIADSPSSVVSHDKERILNMLTEDEKAKLGKECSTFKKENFDELICKLCNYQTKSCKIMLRHLNSHNNGQSFYCKQCDFSTTTRSSWNLHQCKRRGGKYLCDHCSKRFPSQNKLHSHLASMHSEKLESKISTKLGCDICGYIGRDQVSLKEHQRKHTGETLTCPHDNCEFKTLYKRSLQKHLQHKHSKEKTQICEVCGFQTRHIASLKNHIKLHKNNKQYKCAECSYCSHIPSVVLHHVQRKHLKQKKHSCPKCPFQTGYLLAIKKHMARHERIESDEAKGKKSVKTGNLKYYSCSTCGDVFTSMKKAKEHIQRFHSTVEFQIMSQESAKKLPDGKVKTKSEPVVFNEKNVSLDNLLDVDITSDVLDIANNILSSEVNGKDSYTPGTVAMSIPDESMCQDVFDNNETKSVSRKGGNPMLSTTSDALADSDSSLLEESLFDLMSDFPHPPTLNRCQSASTLMFQSLTQHMVDRPLTPDFFTDSPAQSFFQNLSSRTMDQDNFSVSSLNQPFQISSGFPSQIDLTVPTARSIKPLSPVSPNFTCFPPH